MPAFLIYVGSLRSSKIETIVLDVISGPVVLNLASGHNMKPRPNSWEKHKC